METTEYLEYLEKNLKSLPPKSIPPEHRSLFLDFSRLYLPMLPAEIAGFLSKDDATTHLANRFSFFLKKNPDEDHPFRSQIVDYSETEVWMKNSMILEIQSSEMPFVSDSLLYYLQENGIAIRNIITLSVRTVRFEGILSSITSRSNPKPGFEQEILSVFILDSSRIKNPEAIRKEVDQILQEIHTVVFDFSAMSYSIEAKFKPKNRKFIEWLLDDHFIFMGTKSARACQGMFRIHPDMKLIQCFSHLDKESGISFARTNQFTRIRSRKPLFLITIDQDFHIVGVFSRKSEGISSEKIPTLFARIEKFFSNKDMGVSTSSETDFLFAYNLFPLEFRFAEKIANLYPLVRVINNARISMEPSVKMVLLENGRMYLGVLWPIGKYNENIEKKTRDFLKEVKMEVTHHEVRVLSSVIFHFFDLLSADKAKKISPDNLISMEDKILRLLFDWDDLAYESVELKYEKEKITEIKENILAYIPNDYKSNHNVSIFTHDLHHILNVKTNPFVLDIDYRNGTTILNLYSRKEYSLTYLVPMLDYLGLTVLEERNYSIPMPENQIFLYKFYLEYNSKPVSDEFYIQKLEHAVNAAILGKTDSDFINALVLSSPLCITQVTLLKALVNYLFQIKRKYTRLTLKKVLTENPDMSRSIVDYFELHFLPAVSDPALLEKFLRKDRRTLGEKATLEDIIRFRKESIAATPLKNLMETEIFNDFKAIIDSMLRTNYFHGKEYLSFKISSSSLGFMENPRPMVDVWVYHTHLEAVHLRGGKIARGGIRWSDRPDDFRTEIWGLWKAQMAKNTVIIPTGSKGGFIIKGKENNRENGVWAYRTFMMALLEITDNFTATGIQRPDSAVFLDDPDPYLVVAADKGTASFSDYANEISTQKNFWLGDAFASGGAQGYNHKDLGITANGAWESARWGFFLEGKDVFKDTFTVCGIGDMGGDVFGNGMIYSDKIRLVAAFNHLHIFLDPNPEPEKSLQERKRLFASTQSGWDQYNPKLISSGGGIFPRSAASISLSAESRKALGTDKETLSGEELIMAILRAPVDMMFNGGIGTYTKASWETHHDAGDFTNDSVRVNANDLRAKMVVEGGNLGLTPAARMEFASLGGLVNTDALDNSGGVDLSDHEVNLKILLKLAMDEGRIKSMEERNQILQKISSSAVSLVLSNNFIQNKAIVYNQFLEKEEQEFIAASVPFLEKEQIINRHASAIPDQLEILNIIHKESRLPRPLLCNLMASVKLYAQREIRLDIPSLDSFFLERYFPAELAVYKDMFSRHHLAKEIISTLTVNYVVDHAGIGFFEKTRFLLNLDVNHSIDLYMKASAALDAGSFRLAPYFPNAIDRKLDIPYDVSTIMSLYRVIESSLFRTMEIALIYFPDKEIAPEDLKLPPVKDTRWKEPWAEKLDPAIVEEIGKNWLHIEARFLARFLQTNVDSFYQYYRESALFRLKKSLYSIKAQNQWEVYHLISLKRKFWQGVSFYYQNKREIKKDFTAELEQLNKNGQLTLSVIGGMLGYLFDDGER